MCRSTCFRGGVCGGGVCIRSIQAPAYADDVDMFISNKCFIVYFIALIYIVTPATLVFIILNHVIRDAAR